MSGKLWLLWQDTLPFEIVSMSAQIIISLFQLGDAKFLVTIVYAKCRLVD